MYDKIFGTLLFGRDPPKRQSGRAARFNLFGKEPKKDFRSHPSRGLKQAQSNPTNYRINQQIPALCRVADFPIREQS